MFNVERKEKQQEIQKTKIFWSDRFLFTAGSGDGKRLRACEKRLELQSRAKPKIGGFGGNGREAWAGQRMTESVFELARSDWSCSTRRSLIEGGLGGGTGEAGGADG